MEFNNISAPPYKLKLSSKKLESGRFQVKFYVSTGENGTNGAYSQDMYGYVLVEAKDTLKGVVGTIKSRLHLMEEANEYYHTHLYAVRKAPPPTSEFMIFKS